MQAQNEVARLIEAWFKREVEASFRHYHGGDLTTAPATRALTDDIDDEGEQRREARYYAVRLAEHDGDVLQDDYQAGDYARGYEAAREILAELDTPVRQGEQRFTVVAKTVMQAMGTIADARIRWAEGDLGYIPAWKPVLPEILFPTPSNVPIAAPPPVAKASKPMPELSGHTIRQVFERYCGVRQIKSYDDFNTAIRRFIDVHGDLDISRIERRHVSEYRDLVLQLPARLTSSLRTQTVREVVGTTKDNLKVARISPRTVNEKYLAAIKAVLNYACRQGLIENNPASRVVAETPRNVPSKPPVLPYTLADLKALFSCPLFSQGDRPVGGGGEAAVWLPTLALYTGARLEELGRLKVGDVLEEDKVRFLFIRDGKTAAARRKIPIHSALIDLGFLDYVASFGTKPESRIFPFLRSATDEVTKPFSQWWGRYARRYVPDQDKVFHSFRHTVKRALRNAQCDKTLFDAVMGHGADDVAGKYGLDEEGHSFALPVLASVIQKLHYDGLVIQMVKGEAATGRQAAGRA